MLIGLPGSGKSTWIKNFFAKGVSTQYAIISSDDLLMQWAQRDGVSYDEIHATHATDAGTAIYGKMLGCIKGRYSMIIDQTNMTKAIRESKLSAFPPEYKKIAVVLQVPMDVVLSRQQNHDRLDVGKTIPREVTDLFAEQYEPPEETEFDEIIVVEYKQ